MPAYYVRVWFRRFPTLHHRLQAIQAIRRGIESFAVSADGCRAVSAGYGGRMRVWDLDTGALLHTLTGHGGPVAAVAVSANGRHAVSGTGGTMRIWELEQGIELASFASDNEITALAATPSGMHVIVGTSTGPVHLLELCEYK